MQKNRKKQMRENERLKQYDRLGWSVGCNVIDVFEVFEASKMKESLKAALAKDPPDDAVKAWVKEYRPDVVENVPEEFFGKFVGGFIETLLDLPQWRA